MNGLVLRPYLSPLSLCSPLRQSINSVLWCIVGLHRDYVTHGEVRAYTRGYCHSGKNIYSLIYNMQRRNGCLRAGEMLYLWIVQLPDNRFLRMSPTVDVTAGYLAMNVANSRLLLVGARLTMR